MTIKKSIKMKWRRVLMVLSIFIFVVCAEGITKYFPASCGMNVIFSPQTSTLIDFTDPPSGMIQRKQDFESLKIRFLRPVREMDINELNSAIRLFAIDNYWEMNGDEPDIETLDVTLAFIVDWQPCVNCASYPDLPAGPYTDEVILRWNMDPVTGYDKIQQSRFYTIHILKECEQGQSGDDCTNNPITSYDGVTPDPETLIFIGQVENEVESIAPVVESTSLDELIADCNQWRTDHPEIVTQCYVPPHHHLKVNFSEDMGFINPEAIPAWGFYFNFGRYRHETVEGEEFDYMTLESDSAQGMSIGRKNEITGGDAPYVLIVRSDDAVPEENKTNIPYTIDRNGNPLDKTFAPQIYPSHVSIKFPIHFPYSGPDNWYGQLEDLNSEDSPYIQVAITQDVHELRALRPGLEWPPPADQQPDIYFPPIEKQEFDVDPVTGGITARIDIPRDHILHGSTGYPTRIVVHAYGDNGVWLGADELEVYAFPPPPERIKIVSFNAWQAINFPDCRLESTCLDINQPYYCSNPSWDEACFLYWVYGSPLEEHCTQGEWEGYPPWPESCAIAWFEGIELDKTIPDLPAECNPPCWYDPENCPDDRNAPIWPGHCTVDVVGNIDGYRNWQERLSMFVDEVIIPFQPAIVAIQEVYHYGHDCPSDPYCVDMQWGEWMEWFMNNINATLEQRNAGKYFVATNLDVLEAAHGLFGTKNEGHAIIYDPQQVRFIPAFDMPRDGEEHNPGGCHEEWDEHVDNYYQYYIPLVRNPYNDCMTREGLPVKEEDGNDDAYVQRAIFEFPKASNHYLSFYNAHLDNHACNLVNTLQYIGSRHDTFESDLSVYLQTLQTNYGEYYNDKNFYAPEEYWVYPSIYAGDMNLNHKDEGECSYDQWLLPYIWFDDPLAYAKYSQEKGAYYWATGQIDRIWIGREGIFPPSPGAKYTIRHSERHEHQEDDYECFYDNGYDGDPGGCYCEDLESLSIFRCSKVKYEGEDLQLTHGFETRARLMSDHSIVMIELIAEEQ